MIKLNEEVVKLKLERFCNIPEEKLAELFTFSKTVFDFYNDVITTGKDIKVNCSQFSKDLEQFENITNSVDPMIDAFRSLSETHPNLEIPKSSLSIYYFFTVYMLILDHIDNIYLIRRLVDDKKKLKELLDMVCEEESKLNK